MEPLEDDFFIFRFNISNFTSFKDTCLKLKLFGVMFGKHSGNLLRLTWFWKIVVIWFMSVSEYFLNGFRFRFLVVFMKLLLIVLEITLSFLIIASFSSNAILLEFDPLLLK